MPKRTLVEMQLSTRRKILFSLLPAVRSLELPLATFGSEDDMNEKVHPNARGYAVIGQTIMEAIKQRVPLVAVDNHINLNIEHTNPEKELSS